jgi:predicted dehydrogenase
VADKVKLAFVGSGGMGQTAHIQNFATIADCEIVALAEGREKTAEVVSKRFNIPRVYPDHRAMLADGKDIDAVVAIMGYSLHPPVVTDILNAGKHLMTEKPICLRADNARKMAALAKEKSLIYMIGYMKRSLPASVAAVKQINEWKKSGVAGNMNYLRASMPPGSWTLGIQWLAGGGDPAPPYEGCAPEVPPEWMDEAAGKKYNAFVNYFIHQVNLIRYLLGEDYEVVYADKGEAVMIARSQSGVTVVLEMKGHGLKQSWEEDCMVSFDNGKVDLSVPAPMAQQNGGDLRIYWGGDDQNEPRWERPVMPPVWSMLAQARHFVECVKEGKPTWSPATDAVKDLEVAEQYVKCLQAVK